MTDRAKKLRFVFVWFVVVCLLSACSQSSHRVYCENGKWYIEILLPEGPEEYGSDYNTPIPHLTFESAEQLQKMLKGKKIPEHYIQYYCDYYNKDRIIEICNPYEICDLRLPDGMVYDCIYWEGKYYSFSFSSEKVEGSVKCIDFDSFMGLFEKEYANVISEDFTVLDDTKVEDRKARIIHYTTSAVEQKIILYKIETDTLDIYVHENYLLKDFSPSVLGSSESETVPRWVYILGTVLCVISKNDRRWSGCHPSNWYHLTEHNAFFVEDKNTGRGCAPYFLMKRRTTVTDWAA